MTLRQHHRHDQHPRRLRTLDRFLDLTAHKILDLDRTWDTDKGTPVFTQSGKYTTRGWTEWTQGFQYGCAILQYDMTGEGRFLEIGRRNTIANMAPHVSHVGVHDHGFNNVSTWGALRRLALEERYEPEGRERELCELALMASGAVQARRWTRTAAITSGESTRNAADPQSATLPSRRTSASR